MGCCFFVFGWFNCFFCLSMPHHFLLVILWLVLCVIVLCGQHTTQGWMPHIPAHTKPWVSTQGRSSSFVVPLLSTARWRQFSAWVFFCFRRILLVVHCCRKHEGAEIYTAAGFGIMCCVRFSFTASLVVLWIFVWLLALLFFLVFFFLFER